MVHEGVSDGHSHLDIGTPGTSIRSLVPTISRKKRSRNASKATHPPNYVSLKFRAPDCRSIGGDFNSSKVGTYNTHYSFICAP